MIVASQSLKDRWIPLLSISNLISTPTLNPDNPFRIVCSDHATDIALLMKSAKETRTTHTALIIGPPKCGKFSLIASALRQAMKLTTNDQPKEENIIDENLVDKILTEENTIDLRNKKAINSKKYNAKSVPAKSKAQKELRKLLKQTTSLKNAQSLLNSSGKFADENLEHKLRNFLTWKAIYKTKDSIRRTPVKRFLSNNRVDSELIIPSIETNNFIEEHKLDIFPTYIPSYNVIQEKDQALESLVKGNHTFLQNIKLQCNKKVTKNHLPKIIILDGCNLKNSEKATSKLATSLDCSVRQIGDKTVLEDITNQLKLCDSWIILFLRNIDVMVKKGMDEFLYRTADILSNNKCPVFLCMTSRDPDIWNKIDKRTRSRLLPSFHSTPDLRSEISKQLIEIFSLSTSDNELINEIKLKVGCALNFSASVLKEYNKVIKEIAEFVKNSKHLQTTFGSAVISMRRMILETLTSENELNYQTIHQRKSFGIVNALARATVISPMITSENLAKNAEIGTNRMDQCPRNYFTSTLSNLIQSGYIRTMTSSSWSATGDSGLHACYPSTRKLPSSAIIKYPSIRVTHSSVLHSRSIFRRQNLKISPESLKDFSKLSASTARKIHRQILEPKDQSLRRFREL